MLKILLACGAGVATSTAVKQKLSDILDEKGYKGKYKIEQCKVAQMASLANDYDLLLATTMKPAGVDKPFVSAMPFLTGLGLDETIKKVEEYFK